MLELDPRWDWINVSTLGGQVMYVKGQCHHLELEPVTTVDGQYVARLCTTCDAQLPPDKEEGCWS